MVMSSGMGTHCSDSCLQQPPQRSTSAQAGNHVIFGSLGISTGIYDEQIALCVSY